jgi:hypothetical protein
LPEYVAVKPKKINIPIEKKTHYPGRFDLVRALSIVNEQYLGQLRPRQHINIELS